MKMQSKRTIDAYQWTGRTEEEARVFIKDNNLSGLWWNHTQCAMMLGDPAFSNMVRRGDWVYVDGRSISRISQPVLMELYERIDDED